jgi:hypothetical protein
MSFASLQLIYTVDDIYCRKRLIVYTCFQLSHRFFVDDENQALLDVPYPLIDQNPDWVDFWEWGKPWPGGVRNPWTSGSNLAPFDRAVS